MNDSPENEKNTVDVPLELRGLSDEEILALNPMEGNAKRFRERPSKKDRESQKTAKEQEKIRKIAAEYEHRHERPVHWNSVASTKPMPKLSDFEGAKADAPTPKPLVPKKTDIFENRLSVAPKPAVSMIKPALTTPPRPASGRVLSGSFGFNRSTAPKAMVVSAEERANTLATERAQKLKKVAAVTHASAPLPVVKVLNEDGTETEVPVKRGRGRPRKNPLV